MMKHLLTTIPLLLASILPSEVKADSSPSAPTPQHYIRKHEGRPSVAVVLAGGGAKGIAHIGALKVIEEAGIPIDLVVGNSMGAIVGGLYSVGYTPAEMDSIVRAQDWMPLLLDRPDTSKEDLQTKKNDSYLVHLPFSTSKKDLSNTSLTNMGMIKGRRVIELLSSLTPEVPKDVNFDDLPTQFCCIATDANTGKVYEFHEGDIVEAIRSSMAIPGVFTPIQKDSMLLVDGFVVNNFPVDVAVKMGADIIIGVNLEIDPAQNEQLNNVVDVLNHLLDLNYKDFLQRNIDASTLYIPIDVTGYSAASFTNRALDSLMVRGEECSRKLLPELQKLRTQVLGDKPCPPQPRRQYVALDSLATSDKDKFSVKLVTEEIGEGITQTAKSISHLNAPRLINQVQMSYKQSQLNVGARYDNIEDASVLLNANLKLSEKYNSSVDLICRLGDRLKFGATLNHQLFGLPHTSLGYVFEHSDISYYGLGKRAFEVTDAHNRITLQWWQSWRNVFYYFGARFDHHIYRDFMYNPSFIEEVDRDRIPRIPYGISREHYFTYYAYAEFNNKNTTYFATKGIEVSAHLELISDNLYQYKDKGMFPIASIHWESVFSPNSRFSIIPSISSRIIFKRDNDIPFSLSNVVGGMADHHIVEQQFTSAGSGNIEVIRDAFINAELMLRQRIGTNHFVYASGGVLSDTNQVEDFFKENGNSFRWGCKIGYAFRSIIGPLSIYSAYNERDKSVGVFINLGYYF